MLSYISGLHDIVSLAFLFVQVYEAFRHLACCMFDQVQIQYGSSIANKLLMIIRKQVL